jgi:hypothetical protein
VTPQDDLRDPELTALFRRTLGEKKAPASWVENALAVPARGSSAPARASTAQKPAPDQNPPEPWWILLAPHLGALLLIAGAALALLHPTARVVLATHLPRIETQRDALWTLAGLLTPLALVLCAQGSRGFPVFRRFRS